MSQKPTHITVFVPRCKSWFFAFCMHMLVVNGVCRFLIPPLAGYNK